MSNKLLCRKLFSIALPLVAADYVSAANAQETNVTKADAALAAKIKCQDFRKNVDGGLVVPTPKLAATLFPTTALTLMGSASEGRTWPPF
jgi:hypothetical protein